MKKYAIIKKINDNANCPAAHLCGCIYTDDRARRGIVDYFDTLEEANAELFHIAQCSEDNDPASCPAIWSARTWSMFCANVARLGTCSTAAGTYHNGCRHYHDSDVEGYEVVPVIHNEDNDIDQHATLLYN